MLLWTRTKPDHMSSNKCINHCYYSLILQRVVNKCATFNMNILQDGFDIWHSRTSAHVVTTSLYRIGVFIKKNMFSHFTRTSPKQLPKTFFIIFAKGVPSLFKVVYLRRNIQAGWGIIFIKKICFHISLAHPHNRNPKHFNFRKRCSFSVQSYLYKEKHPSWLGKNENFLQNFNVEKHYLVFVHNFSVILPLVQKF